MSFVAWNSTTSLCWLVLNQSHFDLSIDSSIFNSSESRVPDWLKDVDARVQYGINFGKSRGFIRAGDPIIVITGWKQGSGFTNTFRLLYVDTD